MTVWNRNEQISLSKPPGSSQSHVRPVIKARLAPSLRKPCALTLFHWWGGGLSFPYPQFDSFSGCKTKYLHISQVAQETLVSQRRRIHPLIFGPGAPTTGPHTPLFTWECGLRGQPVPLSEKGQAEPQKQILSLERVCRVEGHGDRNLRLSQSPQSVRDYSVPSANWGDFHTSLPTPQASAQ